MTMPKTLGTVGLVGSVLCASMSFVASAAAGQTESADPPSRELLDRHCVACHNDRALTGGLSLQSLDITDVGGNVDVLEKVVRKLRAGQMPPEGRPRPDADAVDTFAGALETALDRVAAADPNPGRVVSPSSESRRVRQRDRGPPRARNRWSLVAAERHGRFWV